MHLLIVFILKGKITYIVLVIVFKLIKIMANSLSINDYMSSALKLMP